VSKTVFSSLPATPPFLELREADKNSAMAVAAPERVLADAGMIKGGGRGPV